MYGEPVHILLVEDNPIDILLTREAFKDARVLNELSVVEDGLDVLDFLYKRGKYIGALRPDLILLDLNLPKRNGREILTEIKNDPNLLDIPVIVLTTSKEERDILESYRLHANCFITKPVDMEQFTHAIKCIEGFWFSLVKLPKST